MTEPLTSLERELVDALTLIVHLGDFTDKALTRDDAADTIRLSDGSVMSGEAALAFCELARAVIATARVASAALAKAEEKQARQLP